jgi:putative acetyltransferase
MEIRPGDFSDPKVKELLRLHLEGMHANSPPGHVFALDINGLRRADIAMWTVWNNDNLLAFGALKEITPNTGEIKSMRTAPVHLRQGAGTHILLHIIQKARDRRYKRLSLETGSGPAFDPALALYRKHGFSDGSAFSNYEKTPFNQFLHLEL